MLDCNNIFIVLEYKNDFTHEAIIANLSVVRRLNQLKIFLFRL